MAGNYSDEVKSELSGLLTIQMSTAEDTTYGEVGFRASEGYDYYYGRKPVPVSRGGSKYVDRTVWDSVNGTLQDALNVFTCGEQTVRVTPQHSKDAFFMKGVNEAINDVILRQNKGYSVLHDTFKESFITRTGFTKRYWHEETYAVEEDFEDLSEEELALYLGEKGADVLSMIEGEGGTFSGKIKYVEDRSQVVLDYVPMEEVFINPDATSIKDARFLNHRTKKTLQEVMDMFDMSEDEVMEVFTGYHSSEWSGIHTSRNDFIRSDFEDSLYTEANDERINETYLDENYVRTAIPDPKKGVRLYQVFSIGNDILECTEVREIPFEVATPFPIPGSIWGESVFDITRDIQNVKTAVMRGYIDNIAGANYGRYQAVKGAYDIRSLLDNRPGGVIEMDAVGMVNLFPHRPLPAGIDNLLEHVEQQKEARTGVSRTSQGLNEDVFKNDNAYNTVNMVMSAAQNRMRMIARNLAQNYMKSLVLGIYELLRENSKQVFTVDTPEGVFQTTPNLWPEAVDIEISVAVGSNERQERATKLTALKQLLDNDARLAPAYGLEQAHSITKDIAESMGIMDSVKYIKPLMAIQPPQPDPMQVAQLQLVQSQAQDLQANAQKKLADAQLAAGEAQFKQEFAADEMDLKQSDAMAGQLKAQADLQLAQAKLMQAQQEMQLAAHKAGIDYALMVDEAKGKQVGEVSKARNEQDKLLLEAQKVGLEQQKMMMDYELTRQSGVPQSVGTQRKN